MKFLFSLFLFVGIAFVVLPKSTLDNISDNFLNKINKINKINKQQQHINENKDRYGNYDPGTDMNFSEEERVYFNDIAKKNEFNDIQKTKLSRWHEDIRIYVEGEKSDFLMNELDRIIEELNILIDPIDISVVNRKSESNYVIYFCSASQYAAIEPTAEPHVNGNFGLFVIKTGNKIYTGSMYVDIYRIESITCQKHILREELTQSLGLCNDNYMYEESIFYQGWTSTTEYTPIDRKLIQMLYNYW